MMQYLEGNWPVVAVIAVLVLLVAWWLFGRASKPAPRQHRPDVLDAGTAPAQRNQALIDAASAASAAATIPPASGVMGGIGEVIAAAVQEEAADAGGLEAAAPVPRAGPAGAGDDLTRIKGVGPKLSALLASLGVTRFDQIAGWSDADVARIDAQLGNFSGRPQRDQWIEQARLLATGDTAGYESRFGKL